MDFVGDKDPWKSHFYSDQTQGALRSAAHNFEDVLAALGRICGNDMQPAGFGRTFVIFFQQPAIIWRLRARKSIP
ncbi:hypothetical protein [Yoonia sp.]|uniref:hypothetical protein n=1 Tax=Yoonia sp. TaxID=2212373 RepID=UPI00391BA9F0